MQRELVLGKRIITGAIRDYRVQTMALPFGSYPRNSALAVTGSWGGGSYRNDGVFLSGAEPSPSPFSVRFDPAQIPRIGTFDDKPIRFGMHYWLDLLRRDRSLRYVSDGDPRTISFPASEEQLLAPRFRARAQPY